MHWKVSRVRSNLFDVCLRVHVTLPDAMYVADLDIQKSQGQGLICVRCVCVRNPSARCHAFYESHIWTFSREQGSIHVKCACVQFQPFGKMPFLS